MIDQLFIALFGVPAIWLSQSADPARQRWAPVFGLLGQPFWIASAIAAGQPGVLFLCLLYTIAWARGFRRHWITARHDTPRDVLLRWKYRFINWFHGRPDDLARRVRVESRLLAHAKAGTTPSPDECRALALELGTPRR